MDLGYLLNWDPIKDRETKKRVTIVAREDDARKTLDKESENKRIVPKITRNDLGYMMNWEPFPKRDDNNGSSGGSTAETKRKGRDNGNMSRIEEETEASASVGANDAKVSSCSRDENDDASSAAAPEEEEDQKRSSVDTITAQHAKNNSKHYSRSEKSTDADTISMPDVEQSFLPLIETNNIIKVDNEPYAKLGVIGKGGSCKVYRALSRECDVVALKKVKLDGLNKQAIDGYANEIALLNRLKGNPAIIQLYSSQVDLERKSIYLVMELGEVDLNYVLRQQELLSSKQGKGGRSSLNMNFIRLTWQQMLSAVHSIHEERIVHSDLKPAVSTPLLCCFYYQCGIFSRDDSHTVICFCIYKNFLFVRGALKLIDFGIAKAIESHDTTNVYRETLSGTLSYMSPGKLGVFST
jgi:serine/threonine-protein kinase TTK/MPS1/adrenodoxin-NADP+ reductase